MGKMKDGRTNIETDRQKMEGRSDR